MPKNPSKWHVTVLRPNRSAAAFDDIAASLVWALMSLGHLVTYQDNNLRQSAWNIVLGAHLVSPKDHELINQMDNVIIYNFEQLPRQFSHFPGYEQVLNSHSVWEYSTTNLNWYRSSNRSHPVYHVPPGYTRVLERIPAATVRDIDILFLGGAKGRRKDILESMGSVGLRIASPLGVYGIERDSLVARSHILLNLHQFDDHRYPELLRLTYLWSNRSAVVSEDIQDGILTPNYLEAARWVSVAESVDTIRELLGNGVARDRLRERAYSAVREDQLRDRLLPLVQDFVP